MGVVVQAEEATIAPGLPVLPGVVLVPAEQVLLLRVALPGMSAQQRKAAVAFAVEEQIACPLEDVHVILGPALPPTAGWLVVVISKSALAMLPAPGKQRLVPDVLVLPVPVEGQWSVWADDIRILVRTPDGAGFACAAAMLPFYHLAADRPGIVLFAGVLDAQFDVLSRADMPSTLDPALHRFDLNIGREGGKGQFARLGRWQPLAAVAVFAVLAHLAVAAVDIWALRQIKATLAADLRGTLATLGQPIDGDLEDGLSVVLARANGTAGARFVPLTARAFAAIDAQAGRVTASDLRYARDQDSLSLQLQAPDITTLQSVETALTGAGFSVVAGAATTRDGLAEQQLTLAGGGT